MSNQIQQHWQQPYHRGIPAGMAVSGQEGLPGQGAYMQFALQMKNGAVESAWFQTYNCPVAIACGSWVAHWVEGKTPAQAEVLEADDVEKILGGFPPGKSHCAQLAVRTLERAMNQVSRVEEK